MQATFKLAYRGELTFIVSGGEVAIRDFGLDDGYYNNCFDTVKAQIGCVYWLTPRKMEEFVPDDIAALFPGYVRARYQFHPFAVKYDGTPPEIVRVNQHQWEMRSIPPKD